MRVDLGMGPVQTMLFCCLRLAVFPDRSLGIPFTATVSIEEHICTSAGVFG